MISIVFDLDGTLADTSRDMLKAANLCFEEMGYSDVLSEEMHRGTALHGGRAMLTKGLTLLKEPDLANIVSEYYPKFLKYYRENLYEKTVFYDGAITCLEKMAGQGWSGRLTRRDALLFDWARWGEGRCGSMDVCAHPSASPPSPDRGALPNHATTHTRAHRFLPSLRFTHASRLSASPSISR